MSFKSRPANYLPLGKAYRRVSDHARRFRLTYSLFAVTVLGTGIFLSAKSSAVNLRDLDFTWVLVNLFFGAPVAISLTAMGLRLSAKMARVDLSFASAFKTCCIATASNVLPIPAGSVIHTSALVAGGASIAQSSIIIIFSNLVSFGWIVVFAGAILHHDLPKTALALGAAGLSIILVGAIALSRNAPWKLVASFFTLAVMRSLVLIGRVLISFAAIGLLISLKDSILFSAAAASGNLVVVAPSGMGVSESLAALLSLATEIEPAQAFIAIALNSLTALLFAGMTSMVFIVRFRTKT